MVCWDEHNCLSGSNTAQRILLNQLLPALIAFALVNLDKISALFR
jgi:hypothetical protein